MRKGTYSMKKKIMIGAPHYSGIPAEFVISTTNMIMELARRGWESNVFYSEGTLIFSQRNKIAKAAQEEKYDYLIYIDVDMVYRPEEFFKMLDAAEDPDNNIDIIGGLYYGRRSPHKPVVHSEYNGEHFIGIPQRDIDPYEGKPFPCAGIGTGFLLISGDVLEKMHEDDFVKKWGFPFSHIQQDSGVPLGEDLSFCVRAAHAGYQVWCHPGVYLGHDSSVTVTRDTHLHAMQRDRHYCNPIDGWMFVRELNWLYETAKEMETICEIGSWKGRSTHALCSGVKGHVYAVDHFKGSVGEDEQHAEAKDGDIKAQFMQNVGKRFANVSLVTMPSLDYAKVWEGSEQGFDMVFLDGGHTYEEMLADIKAWRPLAKKIFSGHDYNTFPGVTRAVNELIGNVKTIESIWYVEVE